jgi:hypothetical protein
MGFLDYYLNLYARLNNAVITIYKFKEIKIQLVT